MNSDGKPIYVDKDEGYWFASCRPCDTAFVCAIHFKHATFAAQEHAATCERVKEIQSE